MRERVHDADVLRAEHPRLAALRRRYGALQLPVTEHSAWTESYVSNGLDPRSFRADNVYLWQERDGNLEANYQLTHDYVASIDSLNLLSTLVEDGAFGAMTYVVSDGTRLSRDLLDSVVEMYFLEHTLSLSRAKNFNVLDIGGGYGRLVHRLDAWLPPSAKLYCVDAIPESTFLSEFYLEFRGASDRARVIAMDEVGKALRGARIDLALNVCSFSECSLGAITWWLDFLRENRVRYLMIVPNALTNAGTRLLSRERDGRRIDFTAKLAARGYELIAVAPKYLDPLVQRLGVSPTHHYLYERRD